MKRSFIALLLVVMILPPYVMALNITPKQTTTTVNAYGEFLNIWIGKNRSIAVQLMAAGGQITLPFDTSRSEFEGLFLMRLGIGVGFRWWLYFHRSIWGDIPPGVSLFLIYKGGTESGNIKKALNLSEYIGSLLGIEFQPFWHEQVNDETHVLFFAAVNVTTAWNIMNSMVLDVFPNDGLGPIAHSPVIEEGVMKERYTRAFIEIVRDTGDIDLDNDTTEFVPILGVAFIVPNAIEDYIDDWYRISLKTALRLPDNFTFEPAPYANVSMIKVTFFIPVEIDETYTTLPDNPGYEQSGILLYFLRVGEKKERTEDDIVIVGKPYNLTEEFEKTPMIITAWLLTDAESVTMWNIDATKFIFTIYIANIGLGEAKNVTVVILLYDFHIDMLEHMIEESHLNITIGDLIEGNWTYENITIEDREMQAFTYRIDSVPGNTTMNITFNLTLPVSSTQFLFGRPLLFYFFHGPLILYRDYENKPNFAMANGFILLISKDANLFAWPILLLNDVKITPEGEFSANATVVVYNHEVSTVSIDSVDVSLIRGLFASPREAKDIRELASGSIEKDIDPGNVSNITLSVHDRLRPGFWTIFAATTFEVTIEDREIRFPLWTESVGVFIGIPYWAIKRWKRIQGLPIPHVELEVTKNVSVENDTLYITVTIKNVGDVNTSIHVIEWLRSDIIDSVTVKVNGTEIGATVMYDTLLGVAIIKTSSIRLDVNTTVIVTIEVKLKANISVNITINPTLVKYDFGPYTPPREDAPEDAYHGCEKEEHGAKEGEEGGVMRIAEFVIAQTATEESTYTNPIPSVSLITPILPPPGGEEEEVPPPQQPRLGRLLIILIPLIAGIVIIVIVAKKKYS